MRGAAAHLRRGRRPRDPSRPHLAGARDRGRRSRRAVPLQRHRVPRDDARRVQAAGGPGERELPLRRRRAPLPPRRRRRARSSSTRELARDWRPVPRATPRCSHTFVGSTTAPAGDRPTLDAVDYEDALAAATPTRDFAPRSADDLYVLYTGGTTGMPKGVMWRHEDVFFGALGGGGRRRRADLEADELAGALHATVARAVPPRVPVHARDRALDGARRAADGRHRDRVAPTATSIRSALWRLVAARAGATARDRR